MWIEEIFINYFGAVSRGCLGDLGPGLTVLMGPNEAGKTTILEFVRSVFLGFRKRTLRTGNIYETPSGNLRSGWLTIRTHRQGKLRVERTEKHGLREGHLIVIDEQGKRVDVDSIPLLRDEAEQRLFQSLFAFDLDSMRQLDQDALRGKIVAAALGSFQTNPLDVMKRVDERIKSLGRRSSRDDGSLEGIQSRIKEIDRRLKLLSEKPKRYEELKLQLESVNESLADCGEEIQRKESLLHETTERLRYEEEWKKLASLDSELMRLEQVSHFPPDGVLRLEQALERLREAGKGVLEEQKILENIRERCETLNPDTALMEYADSIGSLRREALLLAALPGEIDKIRAALRTSNLMVEEEIRGLGTGWNRTKVAESDPSLVVEQEIRALIDSWRNGREKIRDLRSRLAEAAERCERQAAKIERVESDLREIGAGCDGYLPRESRGKLQEWKDSFNRVADLGMKLAEKTRSLKRAIADSADLKGSLNDLNSTARPIVPPLPFWALVVLLACSGIGLLVVGGRAATEIHTILVPIGLLLVSTIPIITRWKVQGDRNRLAALTREKAVLTHKIAQGAHDIAESENQRRLIIQEMEILKRDAVNIATQVFGNPKVTLADILEAEKRSAAAEGPVRRCRVLEDALRLETADAEIEGNRRREIEKSLQAAGKELDAIKAEWAQRFSARGFDPELDPETALELVRRLRDTKNEIQRIAREEASVAAMEREWDNLATDVNALAAKMGRPGLNGISPVDQVEQWARAEREAREILLEKKTFSEKRQEHEVRLSVLRRKVEESEDQIAALMEAAGVADEEAFRERGISHNRYREVCQERGLFIDSLVSGLRCTEEAEMRSRLKGLDWAGNRELLAQLQAEIEGAARDCQELAGRKGRFEKEIETLEAEEESQILSARKEELLARLTAAVDEWITLKMAAHLLDKTLKLYESEKQPRVLEKTSGILRSITGDALTRVLIPLNEERVKVERAHGGRMDESLLSRGTLEQVYLSLRLANLELHYGDGYGVPVLMDDILVNFDPDRAARTAKVLEQFSRETGIQVLFFTCHPHVASLFPAETAVRELGLARHCDSEHLYA